MRPQAIWHMPFVKFEWNARLKTNISSDEDSHDYEFDKKKKETDHYIC